MKTANMRALNEAMRKMAVRFPSAKITVETIEAYAEDLGDLKIADIERACATAGKTCEFFPTISKIRELAGAGTAADGALAWQKVIGAIRGTGSYGSPQFDDARIAAAINRIGGWQHICGLDSDELHKWTSKRFIEEFSILANTGTEVADVSLQGRHEQSRLSGRQNNPLQAVVAGAVAAREDSNP